MAKRNAKRSSGRSMVDLAGWVEKGKKRIHALRAELASETEKVAEFLSELRRQAESLTGGDHAPIQRAAHSNGSPKRGRRGSGQRESIVEFVKGKGEPQGADAIAAHLGKSGKMASVRQTLMQMAKAGTLASYKKDGDSFRLPKKGERGGAYGLPK